MEFTDGQLWNRPKNREALEAVIRSVAKTFSKEGEFDAFIKARNKYVAAMKDGITAAEYAALKQSPEYQALKREYHEANPDWLEPVAKSLSSLYKLGIAEGRSESKHGSNESQ